MRRGSALLLLLGLAPGCDEGSPSSPTFQAGQAEQGYAVCPYGMDASFGSIHSLMLSSGGAHLDGQQSCGANVAGNCHSTVGASAKGTGNNLDFSLQPAAVYAELLQGDGGLVPATNLVGDTPVARVVPFDAGASMLYIKLTLTTNNDPHYGSGMPFSSPGSVCPAALAAVKQWIDQGALPGDLPPLDSGVEDAADAADAATDGGTDGDATTDAGADQDAANDATVD